MKEKNKFKILLENIKIFFIKLILKINKLFSAKNILITLAICIAAIIALIFTQVYITVNIKSELALFIVMCISYFFFIGSMISIILIGIKLIAKRIIKNLNNKINKK